MPVIRFQSVDYESNENESVLDALSRHGVSIPHSCKSGLCHTCLMHSDSGKPPQASQNGLKSNQQQQNYFLSCSCVPEEDMEVSLPDETVNKTFLVKVIAKQVLSDSVFSLRLEKPDGFEYFAGQFINVFKSDELSRSYSLSSIPADDFLELQIRKLPNGVMSNWLFDSVDAGQELKISEAVGTSYYSGDNLEPPLLLIGTGTGLAPLYGIVREALSRGHKNDICLFHGGSRVADLYLHDKLVELANANSGLKYYGCTSQDTPPDVMGYKGRANAVALEIQANLKGWHVFLCGNPEMVEATRKSAFLAGANFSDIFTDPFKLSHN